MSHLNNDLTRLKTINVYLSKLYIICICVCVRSGARARTRMQVCLYMDIISYRVLESTLNMCHVRYFDSRPKTLIGMRLHVQICRHTSSSNHTAKAYDHGAYNIYLLSYIELHKGFSFPPEHSGFAK